MDKKRISFTLRQIGGGVHKRLDENRELYELLQRDAPDFLQSHWWVAGWFESHDEFFTALIDAAPESQSGMFANTPVRQKLWGENR